MDRRTSAMMNHGTRGRYNKGCRCEPCAQANRTYSAKHKRRQSQAIREMLQPISQGPAQHGTWSSYSKGCRCTRCAEAQRENSRNRQRTNRLPVAKPVPLAPLLEREPDRALSQWVRRMPFTQHAVRSWWAAHHHGARLSNGGGFYENQ
jgi:hypothetical protein